MNMSIRRGASACLVLVLLPPAMAAERGFYLSAGAGLGLRADSNNFGLLDSAYTTGQGTAIAGGTVAEPGSAVSWNTAFDDGLLLDVAFGYRFGPRFGLEFEVARLNNGVEGHDTFGFASTIIDSEDAGVLITGSGNLGTTVGELLVADAGRGRTWAYMVNGIYTFEDIGPVAPFIALGAGYARTRVDYRPGGVTVAADSNGGFAFQARLGLTYALTDALELYVDYRFFNQIRPDIPLDLLPAKIDVENQVHGIGGGARVRF